MPLKAPTPMPARKTTGGRALVLLFSLAAPLSPLSPAWAASSASSASSDAGSASVGSLSTSIKNSSTSSSGGEKKAEAGEYRVIEVAQDQGASPPSAQTSAPSPRAGLARLKLQATTAVREGVYPEFYLYLPQPTLEQAQVSTGQLLRVDERSYGLAFSHLRSQEPFFLVLQDDWQRQLQTRVLKL